MEKEKPEILKEINDLTSIIDVKFSEKTDSINNDMKRIYLCLITEICMEDKIVRNGTILSSGEFILSTRDTNRNRKSSDKRFIFNKCGELTKEIIHLSRPFGITEFDNDTIVACSDSKCLHFFENKNLKFKKFNSL